MLPGMLENLTLLDFSSMGPGPRCTRLLADYGVRVVKIRPPADGTRMMDARRGDRTVRQLRPRLAVPDPPGLDGQPAGPTPPGEADKTLRGLGVSGPQIAELRSIGVIT